LAVLLADGDPVPVMEMDGNPLAFDFFGLGQPGPPPFQPQNQGLDVDFVEDEADWEAQ
jgi:hypothetical protein